MTSLNPVELGEAVRAANGTNLQDLRCVRDAAHSRAQQLWRVLQGMPEEYRLAVLLTLFQVFEQLCEYLAYNAILEEMVNEHADRLRR